MNKIKGSFAAKAAAWVGITLSGIIFVASVCGVVLMEDIDVYNRTEKDLKEWAIESTCEHYAVAALDKMKNPKKEVDFGQYFRYGIIQADKIDGLDLNDDSIYLEKNFAREISEEDVYLVSYEVGESTQFSYSNTLFGGYSVYDSWDSQSAGLIVDYICYNVEYGVFYYDVGDECYPVLDVAIELSPDGESTQIYQFQYDQDLHMYRNLGPQDSLTGVVEETDLVEDEAEVNDGLDETVATDTGTTNAPISAEEILNEDYITFEMLDGTTAAYNSWIAVEFDHNRTCLPDEILYVSEVWNTLALPDGIDYYLEGDYYLRIVPQEENTTNTYWVVCVVPDNIGYGLSGDLLVQANTLATMLYDLRYGIYAIVILALALGIFCFVFLIAAAGHRKETEEIQETWLEKSPFDLYLVFFYVVEVLLGLILVELSYYSFRVSIAVLFVTILLCICWLALLTVLTFAVRVKTRSWWRNTLIARGIHWLAKPVRFLIQNLPLLWKLVVCILVILLVEFINMVALVNCDGTAVVFWFFEKAVLSILILWIASQMKTLKEGGEKIASGDLNYRVNTEKMLPEFRGHGENLNNISKGISLAVEDRMKSERFKTELITNVSHDIKTPLTSIINYVDLLEKEELNNETAEEYLEVLDRQSARLKKLIEDLMEASKASTGNLAVNLERLEAGVSMIQTIGEFEEKTEACGLELLIEKPEQPVYIMADSRHFWRVIDNLMNNICKYAQPSTRVYINLEETGENVEIIFRNTSRYPLNISSEELMERFVRGDSSRNTEGSGLGLSIARSLMELMNGSLELYVDGDLYKVILRFPRLSR